MLRVHFTAEDLGRTYVAAEADPLWEVLLSSFALRDRDRPAFLDPWVRRLRGNPEWNSHVRPALRMLADLAPQGPYFPDFLTPAEAEGGLDAGLRAVLRTPRRRIAHELNLLAEYGRGTSPAWLNSLVTDNAAALTHVAAALRRYHGTAVAPHLDLIKASVDADRAHRARHLLDGGVEGMLRGLRPLMDWQPPVLLVRYDVDQDLHLRGRGLRLVPSYFCHGSPVAVADPDLTPVLLYPIAAEHRWAHATTPKAGPSGSGQSGSGQPRSGQPLRTLLGATRADVLAAIERGGSTTELARVLRISPASASRHAAVLRDAGLVTTHRHGPAVLHTLTPLGTRLLDHDGGRPG